MFWCQHDNIDIDFEINFSYGRWNNAFDRVSMAIFIDADGFQSQIFRCNDEYGWCLKCLKWYAGYAI